MESCSGHLNIEKDISGDHLFPYCQNEATANNDAPRELMNCTDPKFMDLNDDCLRVILNMLTAIDLCSLLELSVTTESIRLKDITNEIFKRKYKIINLNEEIFPVHQAQRLLTNFGPLISDLSATYSDEDSNILSKLLIRFCSKTLESLYIKNFQFYGIYQKAAFPKMKSLEMFNCSFYDDSMDVFAHCKSLTKLAVIKDKPPNEDLLQYTFPQLEEICLQGDMYSAESFISRHKKLKMLVSSRSSHLSVLPVVADNCCELEELWMCCDNYESAVENVTGIESISKLKHLRVMIIHFNSNPLLFIRQLSHLQSLRILLLEYTVFGPGVLSELIQLQFLEELVIYECEGLTNFNSLAKLRRLRVLRIISTVEENVQFDIVHVVRHLSYLENLFIHPELGLTIDERIHFRIVNARLKAGSAHRTLRVEIGETKTIFPGRIH